MALVGEAHIVVRAITKDIDKDIRNGFRGSQGTFSREGRRAGETFTQAFSRGFNRNINANTFRRLTSGIDTMAPAAQRARDAFQKLVTTGYTLGTAIGVVVGGIGSLAGGLGGLIGVAGGAAASLAVVANTIFALGAAMATAKLALSGVGRAIGLLNRSGGGGGGGGSANLQAIENAEKALARVVERNREALIDANNAVRESQIRLNAALKEGREEIQQLGFDAEDAALAEQRASIELEKARETLARTQDLPPNNRVRREAELAYQEAELNYRKAKDRSSDLAAEQDRLARTGVGGTQVVIDATNALAEAEANRAKVVRDGLRAEADAQEDLANARKRPSGGGGGGGGANPFAGLNDAQIAFVKFIASLKPQFDELKRIAAESFLPPLQRAITILMTQAFPTVARGIGLVGTALGNATISIAKAITTGENLRDLDAAFMQSVTVIESLGRSLGSLWGSFLSIIQAATPITERFVRFIESRLSTFDNFLNLEQASGRLEKFFNRAGDLMADWGEVFGNILRGIGRLIALNFSEGSGGDILLTWLKDTTGGFANLGTTVQGQARYFVFFQDAARNTISVLGAIGEALRQIGGAGANRNIGITFDILKSGAPYLRELIDASVDAGPALASLVRELTEFLAKTADSGAMAMYFDILKTVFETINNILDSMDPQLLLILGRLAAVGLALRTITTAVKFFGNVFLGAFRNLSNLAAKSVEFIQGPTGKGGIVGAFGKATGSIGGFRGGLSRAANFLTGPWGIAIAGASLALLALNQYIEDINRQTIDAGKNTIASGATIATTWNAIQKKLGDNSIVTNQRITTSIGDLNGALKEMGQRWKDGNGWQNTTYNAQTNATINVVKKLGTTFAEIAATDLPSAQTQFRNLADQTDGTKKRLWELLSNMPDYKKALEEQATQLGINVNTNDEAINKQRLLDLAMGTTSNAAKNLAKDYADLGNKQRSLNADNRSYYETLDTVTAAIEEQREAYLAANGTMDGFKASLDVTTEEGRANQAMLDDLAGSTQRLSESTLAQTGSQFQANQVIEAGRDALIKQMEQMGYTTEEAKKYADQLGLIPKQITTKMYLDTAEASWSLNEWMKNANNNLNAALSGQRYSGMAARYARGSANGNLFDYSGRMESFANGGFPTGIFSGGAPIYKFAEPETNWEAFISGRRGQEERNRGVALAALDRLGGAPTGPNISIQVIAAPGMDVNELAEEVSRKISFNARKGGWS